MTADAGNFTVKDSGKRREFESGMVRDTAEGKTQWHRVSEGPMLRRWAEHLTRGAVKYPDLADGSANWTLAAGQEEYLRFRESLFRHFMDYWFGETDEDHAAAIIFNLNGAEYVRENAAPSPGPPVEQRFPHGPPRPPNPDKETG